MLKQFIKERYINIICFVIAFIVVPIIYFFEDYYFENGVFLVIYTILVGFAICFKKQEKNGKFEEYVTLTKFKKITIIILLILINIFTYLTFFIDDWDAIGYLLLAIISGYILLTIMLSNVIFRGYYLVRYNQKLKCKEFFKENKVFLIIKGIFILFFVVIINL